MQNPARSSFRPCPVEPSSCLSCTVPFTRHSCKPKFRCTLVCSVPGLQLGLCLAKPRICRQANIGYGVTSSAKPELFVNPMSKAAGKCFFSSKVCILSREYRCLKQISFLFSRFGKRFLQGCLHFIDWDRRTRPCQLPAVWSSLCSLWRSSRGPCIPEFLLTLTGAWPDEELQDAYRVFVTGTSSDNKSKEGEYWCLEG